MKNKTSNITLVIGASENPMRYSNIATKRLKSFNHEVIALGLRQGFIDDVPIITDRSLVKDIDTVTLYVGPQHQLDYIEFIVALAPRRVIFNPGTENSSFYKILRDNNIEPIEACTLVMLSTGEY